MLNVNPIYQQPIDACEHPAIESAAYQDIMQRLKAAEAEHNITVLWAIESGSRAWGFHSPDFDYDCRFVYVRNRDWYLSIDVEDRRDVIEYPIVDEIDINGWDLRKALRLMAKANPSIVEWLHSPIVYLQHGEFAALARAWLAQHYAIHKGIYHYRSTAKTNFQQYLCAEQVRLKKYLYVLRPLLAVRWLEQYQQIAPIEFAVLRSVLDDASVQAAIDRLLEAKRQASEQAKQAPDPILHAWIERELARLSDYSASHIGQADSSTWPSLNQIFLQLLHD